MAYSDLSGEPLDGDAATSITCRLDDGSRWELKVTAAEAAVLRSKGQDLSNWLNRAWRWLKKNGKALGLWLAALAITALVLPALTKQWSDRQQELSLKDSFITQVNRGSHTAVTAAERVPLMDHAADAAQQKVRNAWAITEAKLDPRFAIYFKDTTAQQDWEAYESAMADYLALACCDPEERGGDLKVVRHFAGEMWNHLPEDEWRSLQCGPHEGCGRPSRDYAANYQELGDLLLTFAPQLLDDLRASDASGFSNGPGDLAKDVSPFF